MTPSPLATLLLRRRSQVSLAAEPASKPVASKQVEQLEMRLLELGHVITRPLAEALRRLSAADLAATGEWLFKTLAAELGADRPHVPLLRKFPRFIPRDTWQLYVRRVLTWLYQCHDHPCVLCGSVGTVHPVDPCAHLVCRACWDGANYSACPICHRRIDINDPFLKGLTKKQIDKGPFRGSLRPLFLAPAQPEAAGADHLAALLARATPLSPTDRDDLEVLLATFGPQAKLPETIPVKETMALAVGTLLRHVPAPAALLRDLASHLRNATDVLRVLCVWMGGQPDLLARPKPLRSPPRPLRRAFLALLERLPTHLLIEDLQRHPGLWKRVSTRLHPFEDHADHPGVAAAFAVLRATDVDPASSLATTLAGVAARLPALLRLDGSRLRYTSWAGRLEAAFERRDLAVVLRQLEQRPGELLRRLDHTLRQVRRHEPALMGRLLVALAAAAPKASPALALTVGAHLRARAHKLDRRVFFPRGDVLKAFAVSDRRPPLPADFVAPGVAVLEQELLARAAARPAFARAVLDAGLVDLVVPFNERTASRSLVALPRGSHLPVPHGEHLRLFVHWMEADERVDLDLSAAFFDDKWKFVGQCDFTNLSYEGDCAVHSGDLTSAPPPLGASEFVDLDLELLQVAGVAHVVIVVFSYNDVVFDRLPDAFAGYMLRTDRDGEHFDARTVAQRFDLQGHCKLAIPLSLDVAARRMRWLDVKFTDNGIHHQVARYHAALAHLGRDFDSHFGAGARPSLWDLACIHAAARAPEVLVRQYDGSVTTLRRDPDEPAHAFLRRLQSARRDPGAPQSPDPTAPTSTAPTPAPTTSPTSAASPFNAPPTTSPDPTAPPTSPTSAASPFIAPPTTSPTSAASPSTAPTTSPTSAASLSAATPTTSPTSAASPSAAPTTSPTSAASLSAAAPTTSPTSAAPPPISSAAADLPASSPDPLSAAPILFATLRDDLALPAGSVGYALRWLASAPDQVRRLAAADLIAELAPRSTADE
ncbi:MAG: hypothetical protein JNL82_39625 [Myxococcales bacterium]|nr:hypothetical protein [Myxococcales bacterium]